MIFKINKYDVNLNNQIPNLVHLFFALYNPQLNNLKLQNSFDAVNSFLNNYVIYDSENDKVGIRMGLNDTLFINSGIKIALSTIHKNLGIGIGGLYVNKSGKGNAGFDTRAVLVDEDYSGYVHLSMAYTKELIEDGQNIVYCGDKLSQMILIPVYYEEYEEITENEYNKIMEGSLRGSKGFGSSDIKH